MGLWWAWILQRVVPEVLPAEPFSILREERGRFPGAEKIRKRHIFARLRINAIFRVFAKVSSVKPSHYPTKTSSPLTLSRAVFCSVLAVLAATGTHAADGTWTQIVSGTASGIWSDEASANWAGGVVAGGSGATADFGTLNVSGTSTVTLGEPRTIGNLIFGDADTSTIGHWILAGTGGNTLTLQGTTPTITVTSATNVTATISTSISGGNGLTKDGIGVLILSGSNNYTGGTTISAGALRAQNNSALGTGSVLVASGGRLQLQAVTLSNAITLNGSSALLANGGASVLTGNVTLGSNSSISYGSANNISLNLSGTLNLADNALTVAPTANTGVSATISGPIIGSGGIIKAGSGPLNITGDNRPTFSGSVSVTLGTLAVGHDGALGSGTLILNPSNDQIVTVRSTDATARTIGNAVATATTSGNVYRFGSPNAGFNGDLTFSNTTNIAISNLKRFEVMNRTQFDAGFTGNGGIMMQNQSGTLVLNGVNTYSGSTTINAGTLLVNGSLGANSTVTVGAVGTLGGGGTVGGNTTILGVLSPGSSTESLAFGSNLTLTDTANTVMEINGINRGTAVDGYDAIDLNNEAGILTYDGTLTLTMTALIANGTYDLFSFTAEAQGAFDLVTFAGGAYTGTFVESDGVWTATSDQGQVFTFNQATGDLTVVPEPATAMMMGMGFMTLLFLHRRSLRR
jgi:autotransporter-associated beta strand protein